MNKLKLIATVFIFLTGAFVYSQSGWIPIIEPDSSIAMKAVKFFNQNTGIVVGYSYNNSKGVIFRTSNSGITWQRYYNDNFLFMDICFSDNTTGYVAGEGSQGCILKTTNGGIDWYNLTNPGGIYFRICFYDSYTGIAVSKSGYEIITTNGGQTWSLKTLIGWNEPRSLKCLSQNEWILCDWSKIYKTTNKGVDWSIINSGGLGFYVPTLFFVDSTTGYNINMYNTWVYKTTDSGINWLKISSGFGFDFNIWGELYFVNENTGYASGYSNTGSVAKTTNGGLNWFSAGLVNGKIIYGIDFINALTGFACGDDGSVFMTTDGGSVFISSISNEVPDKFELGQNYPNPFNQSSIINFKCKIKSGVSLKVYDTGGREVQTLVNEMLAPGTYQVRFDGSGLASGLYYYSMSIDGKQTAVKKMVMVK